MKLSDLINVVRVAWNRIEDEGSCGMTREECEKVLEQMFADGKNKFDKHDLDTIANFALKKAVEQPKENEESEQEKSERVNKAFMEHIRLFRK